MIQNYMFAIYDYMTTTYYMNYVLTGHICRYANIMNIHLRVTWPD